ncbi:MAG: VOC family protein [Chloroflexota bacterium]|nr:VOC family protein [Chloroflexota bacterium]
MTTTQTTDQATQTAEHAIHPDTTVGLLSLTVSDLDRSVAFYTEDIGFTVLQRDGATATLGVADAPMLLLTERAGAKPWPREQASYTGLYHFAILVPTRADLGRWVRHWLTLGLPLGQGDHLVSEALYLSDPDENGIEIYRDRPRDEWQWANGRVRMGAEPVDIRGLLADAERADEPWTGLPAGTRLGHIHLQVGDIAQATTFYHDILGFDIVAGMPSALFVSAGGYHHHIGMNTWHSKDATPAPADMVGLRFFTVNFPTEDARQAVLARIAAAGLATTQAGDAVAVQDPWQNTLLLKAMSNEQ